MSINNSSLTFCFDGNYAVEYGLEAAILIHHFQFWIMVNIRKKINFHDSRTWTWQSLKDMAAFFPFWTKRQLERNINKLIEKGVLMKGNYNKSAYDRTVWYAFVDQEKFCRWILPQMEEDETETVKCISPFGEMESTKRGNGIPQTVTPIPDSNTDSNISLSIDKEREASLSSRIQKKNPSEKLILFGKYVKLLPSQYEELKIIYGEIPLNEMIQSINDWILSKGKNPYKDFAATIRRWFKNQANGVQNGNQGSPLPREVPKQGVYFNGEKIG